MTITDPKTLAKFKGPGPCGYCRRMATSRDPHHIRARGMGAARRLDVAANLIALCRLCHNAAHAGKILRCDLLALVAQRERCLQADLEAVCQMLRRLDQRLWMNEWPTLVADLTPAQRALAEKTREEAGL